MARISRGRQKIEIKKMTNVNNLHVTFSKRRFGVFKKASELCTLCGVDAAVVTFSPGQKVYSFGHESVETVIHRFIHGVAPTPSGPVELIQAYRKATIRDLNAQLMQLLEQLDAEQKKGQELKKMRMASQAEFWWQNPVSKMNKEQLGELKFALEKLRKNVAQQHQTSYLQNCLNNNAADQPQSLAPNFGAGDYAMLPTAGTSGVNGSDVAHLSDANAKAADGFHFYPNYLMPPPAATPPAYDYGFENNGF